MSNFNNPVPYPNALTIDVSVTKLNKKITMVHICSEPQKVKFNPSLGEKNHFILINTCSGMIFNNERERTIISQSDSIIIPAWHSFTEESLIMRDTISFIIEIDLVGASPHQIEDISWKPVSQLNYGHEINKLISNFYFNNVSGLKSKSIDALTQMISLEIESKNHKSQITNHRVHLMSNIISHQLTNCHFNVRELALQIGVSERMIQYEFCKIGTTFKNYLSKKRAFLLAEKIKNQPNKNITPLIFDCGFDSLSTANRQLQKFFIVHQNNIQSTSTYKLNGL